MAILFKAVAAGSGATTATTTSLGSAAIGDLVVVAAGGVQAGSSPNLPTDNAGNTYTQVPSFRNDGTNGGAALFYSFLTVANAALTVSYTPTAGVTSIVAHLLSGALAYNADPANNADFSGTSTAWAVGPTTLTPPANSIVFYTIGAGATETATPNAVGYNTTGANGFTAGMNTAMHQETKSASAAICVTGYKITSAAASASVTLPAAANWFGVIASFSPTLTPTKLAVTRQPSASTATGAAQATQPAVTVQDASNATVTTDTSTVTASLVTITGTGTAFGTLTKAAVSGVADFSANGLGVTSAAGGTFQWSFTDGALTSANTSTFTITAAVVGTQSRMRRRRR